MNPWQVLEVARNADAREIKRAYAKKLKVIKPDEKPAEFQILHRAYKTALNFVNHREVQRQASAAKTKRDVAEDTATHNEISLAALEEKSHSRALMQSEIVPEASGERKAEVREFAVEVKPVDDSTQENHSPTDTQAAEDQLRRQEYDRLVAETEARLKENSYLHNEAQWHFLATTPYLLEDGFNWFLGREVFRQFAQYSQIRVRGARGRYYHQALPADIVNYCDQLFSWRNRTYFLQQEFGDDFCRALFEQLEEEYLPDTAVQSVRGGMLIRGSPPVRPRRQKQEATDSDGMNNVAVFFIGLLLLAQIFRYVFKSMGN